MISKSKFNAKYLLALSAVIVSASVYFGNQWQSESEVLQSAAPKFEKEATEGKTLYDQVAKSLGQHATSEPMALSEASVLFLADLKSASLRHALKLQRVSIASSVSSEAVDVYSLAKPVGSSQLKAVTYKVEVVYISYEEFQSFLKSFEKMPVAITGLKMKDSSAELDFTLFGK
jgi:hypothetical protein